jgi:hypothetical protein
MCYVCNIFGYNIIGIFVIANMVRQKRNGKSFAPATQNKMLCCVFILIAGETTANGLFHFVHGLLRYSDFPAPFTVITGGELFTNISNIIWGFLNFTVAIFVVLSYRKTVPMMLFILIFFIGFSFVSLLLRFAHLPDYYQLHSF